MELAEAESFDIGVLDVMMPKMDGFEVLANLREFSDVPVILLTARKEEYDKLFGLNLGGDDYVPKPFSPKELMAQVKEVLKRTQQNSDFGMKYGALEVFEQAHTVHLEGVEITVTPKEYDLLVYLVRNNHITLNREPILKHVWGSATLSLGDFIVYENLRLCRRFQKSFSVPYVKRTPFDKIKVRSANCTKYQKEAIRNE